MHKLFMSFLFLNFLTSSAQVKDTSNSKASLTSATVYFGYGAQLQQQSKTNLNNGTQIVVINNIALQPDINTMQITCPENVTILSFYHRLYSKPRPVVVKPVNQLQQDSLKKLQKALNASSNEYSINEDVLARINALIENNFTRPDKKDISSEELIKLTNFYTGQIKQIRQKLFDLQQQKNEIVIQISQITNRINEQQPQPEVSNEEYQATGQLILQVMSKSAGSTDFEFSYFTRNAGWVPSYDIRVKTIDNSFKLVYKAMVSQSTGLNWEAIKLNLSTSNPNQGTTIPTLSPYFLQLYVPQLYANINEGYTSQNLSPTLSEVVVSANRKVVNDNVTDSFSTVGDFLQLKESQLNTNFEIDLPYDIPSDGNAYAVTIKDEKIPATYQHFAVPKLDRDAFLMAQLSRWDSLSLLPGQANIIMDNIYLGKSFIDPNITTDTLNISLGRDKRIALNRKMVKDYKNSGRGDSKTELYTYEITIKNNKKQPVTLLLKDQIPISRTKEVEVTLTSCDFTERNLETGQLSSQIQLQPGESKKIRFGYQIKYPKNKVLQETR